MFINSFINDPSRSNGYPDGAPGRLHREPAGARRHAGGDAARCPVENRRYTGHQKLRCSNSTLRPSERSSLTKTLKDSGMPASKLSSPRTIASYTLVRPETSSDLTVSISCRV